jgi:hypothetical protein
MTTAKVSRQEIIDTLAAALEPAPFVHAAWLGGSDASGRTDQWSDIDLQVVVDDDRIDETFGVVHEAVETLSPIAHRHRLPQPTWHGHEQELLSLRDAEECHFLDLVILRRNSENWFLEPERHGQPLILFDKGGLVRPAPFDREAHRRRMAARLAVLRATFPLFQNLVTKATCRKAGADAVNSYLAMTIRPLVELLRMRFCPDRFDYGLRYLDRDLPPGIRLHIEKLVFPETVDDIERFRAEAARTFEEQLRDLDAGAWGADLP